MFRLSQQSGWEWDCDAFAGFVLTMTHMHVFQTDIFIQALLLSPPFFYILYKTTTSNQDEITMFGVITEKMPRNFR